MSRRHIPAKKRINDRKACSSITTIHECDRHRPRCWWQPYLQQCLTSYIHDAPSGQLRVQQYADHGGPEEESQQRGTVSNATRNLYKDRTQQSYFKVKLRKGSPAAELDRAMRADMLANFLQDRCIYDSQFLFYALRWDTKLKNDEILLSHAPLPGHRRRERGRAQG